MMNSADTYLPKADLVVAGKVPDVVRSIFSSWYDIFSTDNKMKREDCARFVKGVTGAKEYLSPDDQRISQLLDQHDRTRKGYIDRDEFVNFYIECCFRQDKKKVVWENLNNMGIRNDLKRYSEPLEIFNTDKTILPRYRLSHNEKFFNTIFNLQDLDNSIAREAFHFIHLITTNPVVYHDLLSSIIGSDTINWNTKLDNKNVYRLIYSLEIIESFIEDIEIDSRNIDSFSNEETIMDSKDNLSAEEVKHLKIDWMKNFIVKGGFNHLIKILNEQLEIYHKRISENSSASLMENICLQLLIKIVKIFFNASLNRYDFYHLLNTSSPSKIGKKENKDSIVKGMEDLNLYSSDIVINNGHNEKIERKQSNLDTNALIDLMKGDLGETIYKSFNFPSIIENLEKIMVNLSGPNRANTEEENYIIENAFEFLIGVITFSEDKEEYNKLAFNENLSKIISFGIFHSKHTVREKFANILIKFTKYCEYVKNYNLVIFLVESSVNLSTGGVSAKSTFSDEFFEVFSSLLEIVFKSGLSDVLKMKGINLTKLVEGISESIYNDIENSNQNLKEELPNEIFVGYIKILTTIVAHTPELKQTLNKKYNLLSLILTKILFVQGSQKLLEQLTKLEFINPDKFSDGKNTRGNNQNARSACYKFVLAMLKDSIENFEEFFSLNVFENENGEEPVNNGGSSPNINGNGYYSIGPAGPASSSYSSSRYQQSNASRREEHVGLRNLGCICYMNSMLQQFFMVPSFRYSLLQADDQKPVLKAGPNNVDDNILHQVQRMFTYLDMSKREDYNPQGFCYAFKDWDGNPTNTSIQQDSQEFLNRFFDKIESSTKDTPYKYLMQSIFGGKTCSQLVCEDGCGTSSNRLEEFYNLSLGVQNLKNLTESLEKFIAPEKIDEYNCETCQKKVTITKRNSLAVLPNVLIIHLQRIFYNYEYDRNEKINSKLEFPQVLNLKNYCIEEIMRRNKVQRGEAEAEYENDEIYQKSAETYEYHLTGVNVHIGSADAGHYFSYINTIRNGESDQMSYDPNNEAHQTSWLKFNDSYVSKFNYSKLEEECFGGSMNQDSNDTMASGWNFRMSNDNIQSAYMLIYERRTKTPIKLIVPEPANKDNVVSFKSDETAKVSKQYDLSRVMTQNERRELSEELYNKSFYDAGKNEYFQFKPFYSIERLIPKSHFSEISDDNGQFTKQQNIHDEQFIQFFSAVMDVLDETLSNLKDVNRETSLKIGSTLVRLIYTVLSTRTKKNMLRPAIDKLLQVTDISNEVLYNLLDYIVNNYSHLYDAIHNSDPGIVETHCHLLYEIIKRGYSASPEEFMKSNAKNEYGTSLADLAVKLTDYLFDFIPKVSNSNLQKIYPIYNVTLPI